MTRNALRSISRKFPRASNVNRRGGERLIELDPVPGGVGEERLSAHAGDLGDPGHVHATSGQHVDRGVDVADEHGEVLTDGSDEAGHFDEVQLLIAEAEPGTGEVEHRPVQELEPEHVAIERDRLAGIGDVDRHVVDPFEGQRRFAHAQQRTRSRKSPVNLTKSGECRGPSIEGRAPHTQPHVRDAVDSNCRRWGSRNGTCRAHEQHPAWLANHSARRNGAPHVLSRISHALAIHGTIQRIVHGIVHCPGRRRRRGHPSATIALPRRRPDRDGGGVGALCARPPRRDQRPDGCVVRRCGRSTDHRLDRHRRRRPALAPRPRRHARARHRRPARRRDGRRGDRPRHARGRRADTCRSVHRHGDHVRPQRRLPARLGLPIGRPAAHGGAPEPADVGADRPQRPRASCDPPSNSRPT